MTIVQDIDGSIPEIFVLIWLYFECNIHIKTYISINKKFEQNWIHKINLTIWHIQCLILFHTWPQSRPPPTWCRSPAPAAASAAPSSDRSRLAVRYPSVCRPSPPPAGRRLESVARSGRAGRETPRPAAAAECAYRWGCHRSRWPPAWRRRRATAADMWLVCGVNGGAATSRMWMASHDEVRPGGWDSRAMHVNAECVGLFGGWARHRPGCGRLRICTDAHA